MASEALIIPRDSNLSDIERAAIEAALSDCDDNRTRAARRLGISLRTLQRRVKNYAEQDRRRK